MIPAKYMFTVKTDRKPRASGDDPSKDGEDKAKEEVNPARAGMIR